MNAQVDDEVRGWVALSMAAFHGTAPWLELLGRFSGSTLALFDAGEEALAAAGARPEAIAALRKSWREAGPVLSVAARLGLGVATLPSDDYPPLLREIPDPPLVLYWQGRPPSRLDPAVAVVGSRRCSDYGRRVAGTIASDAAAAGVTVVSGLARGIDAAAHRGAMRAGRTAAVLAGGLDRIYPAEHHGLADEIVHGGGCIVSEQAPGHRPLPLLFPYRNRIITGLARATVVVEAGRRSGSLASARHALAQGREVFVVPGPIDSPLSIGTNALAQQGCNLLIEANDMSQVPGLSAMARSSSRRRRQDANDFSSLRDSAALAVVAALRTRSMDLDGLIEATALDGAKLLALLTALELDGLVERGWGGNYSCTPLAAAVKRPRGAPAPAQPP